ncbi:iron ABC transporter substrate-binding protein [Paenibacillus sp. FSL H8-0548]|uniref:ABC transporter substrate-binding protein n=1 Tax=Paenibacillus sp. FSL H8-0548 TaxID=1920422 RepID=UPI00096FD583|nr:ABC transporter substrate-binding protein [Paenibacillus sp. FSL H8-0548]OMF28057.1 iron ABC transporter substrate-binding protein [Paenibacillus sp. FSL H8-0548]
MIRMIRSVLLLAILTLFLASCSMKSSGSLVIYAGLYEDHAIRAIEMFQKETGIKVSYTRLSAGEVLERIRKEKDNPNASVWFGGTADTFVQAKQEGLLEPYESINARMIDPEYKDAEGYWTGIYIGSIAFISNKTWLQQTGLSVPQSWEDLLKPEYRTMIAMGSPNLSGTGYTVLATIIQLLGEEKGFDYFRKLNQLSPVYTSSGSTSGRAAGMGDVGTAIAFSHDAIKLYKEGFQNIVISFPKEGTGYEIGGVGIIKNGPNMEEARKFVDWSLTKQAQEIGKQVGNYQMLTNQDAIPPEEAISLQSINVITYDFNWAGSNRERLITKWKNEVLQKK